MRNEKGFIILIGVALLGGAIAAAGYAYLFLLLNERLGKMGW